MRDRILLQSLVICLLIGWGTFQLMGSPVTMKYFAHTAGTLGLFFSDTAPRLVTSPEAILSLMGIGAMTLVARYRRTCTQATR